LFELRSAPCGGRDRRCGRSCLYDPAVVPEAPLHETEAGLVHAGGGWLANGRRLSRTHEIERTLLNIKGLVDARAIFEDERASLGELAEHSAELERQRLHLAPP
jgi:hypothetical protein